jgi:MarR family 2-MHQ and catechol resistance regulon transcriptional repressor
MQTSGTRLWLILWKAHDTLMEHALCHIRSLGLGYSDFGVLEMLLHKGPTPVNEIGRKIRLTSGSITAAVDRLEKKGLVERCCDPADRRARLVHLTPAGRETAKKAFAAHGAAMERATSGLTAEERGQAAELLKKLGLSAQEMLPD